MMQASVGTFDELKSLLESREPRLTIGIMGKIKWPAEGEAGGIATDRGDPNKVVDLHPASEGAGFDFRDMIWPGWGDGDDKNSKYGIMARNRIFRIHGLTLYGFDVDGTVLRIGGQNVRSFVVSGCRFVRCGTRVIDPRGGWEAYRSPDHDSVGGYYVPNAQQVMHCNPIAGQSVPGAQILVEGTVFEDCALNAWAWAHNVYCSAEHGVVMLNNTHRRCGNPYALGNADNPEVLIRGDVIEHGALCIDRYRGFRRAYVTRATQPGYVFIHNRVVGATSQMHDVNTLTDSGCVFDHNDYSGAWLEENYLGRLSWAVDRTAGNYPTQEDWREAGHDFHSHPMSE